ncbi:Phage tail-collar fibre protein [Cohnella sp. OV330]|uniref:phage tail-collar fiber domain-containing protein n=1 Tax=Cohnella sp. OV330 TaxID=1855288 RepID=UPI0008E0CCB9|nr:phage tail protein [Cohnella sp. OV330]SFA91384.1 Phage tail-collar fibre protein [Cohnella sp. OV330]
MGLFAGFYLTNKGQTLQTKVQAGATLQFTRIAIGDGNLGAQTIANLTALISQKKSMSITKLEALTGGKAVVGTSFNNSNVTTAFYMREVGVFAQDPDVGEVLYCYANAGSNADLIPAGSGNDILERYINVITLVGNAANVTAVIDNSLVFALASDLGSLSALQTTDKSSAVAAINELFTLSGSGKTLVAAAITGKGVPASASETFAQLAAKIDQIVLGSGNAAAGDVLAGKTFSNDSGPGKTGTMPNRGAVVMTPGPSDQAILAGYHNGAGKVSGVVVDPSKLLAGSTIAGTAGSMPNRGAVTFTPGPSAQTIQAGYHNGSGSVAGVTVPAAAVLSGTTIAGTAGIMPNRGRTILTPSKSSTVAIPEGYHNGTGYVQSYSILQSISFPSWTYGSDVYTYFGGNYIYMAEAKLNQPIPNVKWMRVGFNVNNADWVGVYNLQIRDASTGEGYTTIGSVNVASNGLAYYWEGYLSRETTVSHIFFQPTSYKNTFSGISYAIHIISRYDI